MVRRQLWLCWLAAALLWVALGAGRATAQAAPTPPVRPLAGFEGGSTAPFTASGPGVAAAVPEHAAEGRYALRLTGGYVTWQAAQDWTGYDFLKADVFNSGDQPAQVYVEVHDAQTTGYWTRVNYTSVVPPGASTLIVPTALYVGEKSRPGRALDRAHVTDLALSTESKIPLYFDALRLERDLSDRVHVPGLRAFSFGPAGSPGLSGLTPVAPDTLYTSERGYGLKNAHVWKALDVLQPDPLYEKFLCIESGGFAVDLPDGRYHVFLNIDNPSGFWGEYQVYRQRVVKANGVEVVHDTMDLPRFLQKYFRFADVEDRPQDNTFDKYQRAYFHEKEFDVDVRGGQLSLEFEGQNWANSLSAVVIYPAAQAALGKQYLQNLAERRRFYFDNYFKRVLPNGLRDSRGAIPPLVPTPQEQARGYVPFVRDWMEDVPVTAVPRRDEVTRQVSVFASAGEQTPVVFSLYPLRDQGPVTVRVSDLVSPGGARVPASAIRLGVVSHRLSRVTGEGTVYTIAPRYVLPRATAPILKGATTTFWLTLRVPPSVKAGAYQGRITLTLANGRTDHLTLSARLFATPLDAVDVAAGPWGSNITLPWYSEDLGDYNRVMFRKCLAKMRDYGCTTFSGIPTLRIRGWQNGTPDIDFTQADGEMADARAEGFHSVVVNYNGGIGGFNNYAVDEDAMKAAGFTRYPDFLRAVLTVVDAHARAANWLPVAYNLCDEPIGDDVPKAVANAQAWREAAPPTLLTTGATSMKSPTPDDPHLALARALKIANLTGHDQAAVQAIKAGGSRWAFYNDGSRWTFGTYLYKAAQAGLSFRLDWHWNASAGDPYYALDCREDDYAWCSTNAQGDLIPTIHFERDVREGLTDYRYLFTLSRLLREKPNHPGAAEAQALIDGKLSAFALGDTDHDGKWPRAEYRAYRLKLAEAIERLSQ